MKKIFILIVVSLIIASCLYLPWQRTYRDGNTKQTMPHGYSWFFNPPPLNYKGGIEIDYGRLSIQIGLLVFLGGCVVASKYIFPQFPHKRKLISNLRKQFIRNKKWAFVRKVFFYPAFGFVIFCAIGLFVALLEKQDRLAKVQSELEQVQQKQSSIIDPNESPRLQRLRALQQGQGQ